MWLCWWPWPFTLAANFSGFLFSESFVVFFISPFSVKSEHYWVLYLYNQVELPLYCCYKSFCYCYETVVCIHSSFYLYTYTLYILTGLAWHFIQNRVYSKTYLLVLHILRKHEEETVTVFRLVGKKIYSKVLLISPPTGPWSLLRVSLFIRT